MNASEGTVVLSLAPPREHSSDEDIARQVADVLRSYGPTRQLLLDSGPGETRTANQPRDETIRVSVRNGVVILVGNVDLRAYAGMAERLVRRVTGVREVLNLLLADDELQTSVTAAIHHDPRTRMHAPKVSVDLGRVTLMGSVADAASRDAAREVAAAVHGVRGVLNQLRVAL